MRDPSAALPRGRGEPQVLEPLISVLLPYRDAGDTIEEALSSILAEDVPLEVLAVDDGSTDAGPARVASMGDPRVRRLSTGGAGLIVALELARREAKGRWLARMDADDVSLPGRLLAQREALDRTPRLGAIGTRVEAFPDGAVGEGMRRYVAWQNALLDEEDHARARFVEAPLCHPSVMLRREALDAVGGYRDVGWPEDYDLWLRLVAAGWGLAKLPRVGLRWRHHEGRATFTHPRYAPAALRRARAAFLGPWLVARGRPVAIWGAGRTGTRLARELELLGVRARRWIDIDPTKIGGQRRGAPVHPPEDLRPGEETLVVAVGARGARDEVRARLVDAGLVEASDFICAA